MSSEQAFGGRPAPDKRRSVVVRSACGIAIGHPHEADEYATGENVSILESWRNSEDPALSIARGRLAPGATSAPHRLRGIEERYIILSGQGFVEIPGEESVDVGPGDIVYFPAGATQTLTNTGETDLLLYAICTPPFEESRYEEVAEPEG